MLVVESLTRICLAVGAFLSMDRYQNTMGYAALFEILLFGDHAPSASSSDERMTFQRCQ